MRKLCTLLLVTMLLCLGCDWRLSNNDDNPDWLLSVSRYDRVQSLYLTTGDLSALQQMNTDYPQQTRTLIEDVLHLGRVNEPQINTKFLRFYQDSTLQTLIAESQRQYADMSDVNSQLSDAFERLLKELPDLCLPDVYTQVGSLDQSIVISGDMLGISLDKYLGADYPLYRKYGYSLSQRQTMQRDYIVPDAIAFYLLSLFPAPHAQDSLSIAPQSAPEAPEATQQQRDGHIGRIQWVVNRVTKRRHFNSPHVLAVDRYMKAHPHTTIRQLLTEG